MSDIQKVKTIFDDWLLEVQKDLKKRGSYWTPTLVTEPLSARTVVLRSLEFVNKQDQQRLPRFIVHTDVRSKKWQDLAATPTSVLHFYCPKRKWQMRIGVTASLFHGGPDATIEWKRLSSQSKRIYSLSHAPGTETDNPEEAYSFGEAEEGKKNFGVIYLSPVYLESLQLERPNGPSLHIRARWDTKSQHFSYLAP